MILANNGDFRKKNKRQNKTITKITLPLPTIEKNNNKAVK